MLLWIFFIAVSFLLGLAVSSLLSIRFLAAERAFFSLVVGHAISIWLVFLLSCLNGALSVATVLQCVVLCAAASVVLFGVGGLKEENVVKGVKGVKGKGVKEERAVLVFFAVVLLYLVAMNLHGVFRADEAGNLYAIHTVWADYPFHTSLATAFAYSENFSFPPSYPQFSGTKMHYPFLMDFYSAVLMKAGLSLRGAFLVPNILFQFCFFGLFYSLARRLTGSKRVGALSVFIFIFSGFPSGLQSSWGIHFLNPMYAVLMPQRTAMLGLGVSFAVYILLFHALFAEGEEREREEREEREGREEGEGRERKKGKELFLAGTLVGLLPYIHAHSFMATALVSLTLFILYFAFEGRGKNEFKAFIFLFAPLILLALPQVLCIKTAVSEGFFVFFPGWTAENRATLLGFDWSFSFFGPLFSAAKAVFVLARFWMLNLGALFFLLPLGFLKSARRARVFYLPFLLLFVLANFVKFQPWCFDNYKMFLHWHALTVVLASVAIFWVADRVGNRVGAGGGARGGAGVSAGGGARGGAGTRGKRKEFYAVPVSVAFLVVVCCSLACTFFGFATHAEMLEQNARIWSAEEVRVAEWVRENTPSESVFLTGSAHNHPIPSLAGRQRVMGYEGWLWSHGINWTKINERKRDEIAIYSGDFTLLDDYGVDYVCVGPYERAFATENHFKINDSAFDDERLKYVAGLGRGKWKIYSFCSHTLT